MLDDNIRVKFVDTLNNQPNNIIKLDLLVFDEFKKIFLEFSCNYYVVPITNENIVKSLLLDVKKYYHEEKYMKVLKRLYSYNIIMKYRKKVTELENIFNSEAGRLNQFLHNINLIIDAIKFNVNKNQISQVINQFKTMIDDKYKKYVTRKSLEKLTKILKTDINELIEDFV